MSWTVAVAVLLTWVWRVSWTQDPQGTKRLAEREGTSRSTDVWLLAAAVASLAVVVVALVQSGSQKNVTAVASVILSVTLSWALVNTVYAFKYARLYYFDEPDEGGIDFKQDGRPTYSDFAYPGLHRRHVVRGLRNGTDVRPHQKGGVGSCPSLLRVRHGSHGGGHQLGH